jgi:hypothetical protein
MDRRTGPTGDSPDGTFEPVATGDRPPPIARWALVAVLALLVVIAKPWSSGSGPARGSPGAEPSVPATSAADTTARPSGMEAASASSPPFDRLDPEVASFCLDLDAWLTTSIEQDRGQEIRVWRALEPATSVSGPDDAAIPIVSIVTEGAAAFGWCAPSHGADRPVADRPASIDIWRAGIGGALPIDTTRWPGTSDSPFGGLYRPVSSAPGSRAGSSQPPPTFRGAAPSRSPDVARPATSWPDGRYVFHYRQEGGWTAWFSIEIENHVRADR